MKTVSELRSQFCFDGSRCLVHRTLLLAHAFARGRAYRRAEPVCDPMRARGLAYDIARELLGTRPDDATVAAVQAWLDVPDTAERIAKHKAKRDAWMERGRAAREHHARQRAEVA